MSTPSPPPKHDPKLVALVAAAQEYREACDEAKTAVLASAQRNEAALAGMLHACQGLMEVGQQVGQQVAHAARSALQDAVRSEAAALAAPMQRAANDAATAATATREAARSVQWAWLAVAFLLGASAGAGAVWWLIKGDLAQIRAATHATWEQTRPKPR